MKQVRQKWRERDIQRVAELLERNERNRPKPTDPDVVRLAAELGRSVSAVIMRANELLTAYPDYDGKRLRFTEADKRVIDALVARSH